MFSASRGFPSLKLLNNKNGRSYSSGNSDRFVSLLIPLRPWPSDRRSGQPYSSP